MEDIEGCLYLFLVVSYFEEKSKIIEIKLDVQGTFSAFYYYFDLRLTYYLLTTYYFTLYYYNMNQNTVSIVRQQDTLILLEQLKSVNNSNKNLKIKLSNLMDSIVDKRQNDIKLILKNFDYDLSDTIINQDKEIKTLHEKTNSL